LSPHDRETSLASAYKVSSYSVT